MFSKENYQVLLNYKKFREMKFFYKITVNNFIKTLQDIDKIYFCMV